MNQIIQHPSLEGLIKTPYKRVDECPLLRIDYQFDGRCRSYVVNPIAGGHYDFDKYQREHLGYFAQSEFKLLLPKLPGRLNVEQIREDLECGVGQLLGYYAYGHWDARSFAIACHNTFGIDWVVSVDAVVHGWVAEYYHEAAYLGFLREWVEGGRRVTYWEVG